MRLVRLRAPGGLENLKLAEDDHLNPRPGELLVRIRASSLNFHDDMVVLGKIPCADGRIPMSDGAGEVISVGENVDEFKVGDNVVGTFWPFWLGGEMTPATKRDIPGDSIDGYAREYVCAWLGRRRQRIYEPVARDSTRRGRSTGSGGRIDANGPVESPAPPDCAANRGERGNPIRRRGATPGDGGNAGALGAA